MLGLVLLLLLLPRLDADTAIRSPRPEHREAAPGRHALLTGAARWHETGARGQGIKVAVLDTGFRGYRAYLGEVLPPRVTARSFRGDGAIEARDSQHGILCGEVLHALAPDAELLFANWEPDRPDQFLRAVRWAREQGARVLSCSVIMPSWSDGEGNGPVHEALARLLGDGSKDDALCFASAGNTAERHWCGEFRDAGGGWHEWAPGETDNHLTPWSDETVSVELYWPRGSRYELVVWDPSARVVIGQARDRNHHGHSCAVVRVTPHAERSYRVRVRRVAGEGGLLHLVALGGGLSHATARGSIPFPGDGPEVITVGAVDGEERRPSYSSCGPNSPQPKPDLVAVVPFPSRWRSRPFTGTSAAAPQAAALAALLWSRHPDWTAAQVRQSLTKCARDLGDKGHDPETGHGLLTLPPLQ
jgi:subtilisin family serine protease